MTTTAKDDHRNEMLHRLAHASEDVQAARRRYLDEQEALWKRYEAVVEQALREDLRLGDDEALEGTPDLVHALLAEVRYRIDELRIRAHLGRMDLEDLASELHAAASRVVDHLRP